MFPPFYAFIIRGSMSIKREHEEHSHDQEEDKCAHTKSYHGRVSHVQDSADQSADCAKEHENSANNGKNFVDVDFVFIGFFGRTGNAGMRIGNVVSDHWADVHNS